MSLRAVAVGLVVGLVFGAAITSLVWVLATDQGDEDLATVCRIVEQSALPDEDTPIEEIRRWSAANEMMPSIAKGHPEYQPLADTLDRALRQWQRLDLPAMREEVDRARALCADY